jgi:cell division transport system ATP-binding protein
MIALKGVSKLYPPDQAALRNVDLRLGRGEFLFIAGASGAGKSTLLKLIFGSERVTSGDITVAGRNMRSIGLEEISYLRRDLGIVFQDYKLLERRSVLENVVFGLEVRGVPLKIRQEAGLLMLRALGIEDKAEQSPLTLSGGEQQRVAIGRALIHKPKIVLADEPTGNLDPDMTRMIFRLLLEANTAGVTVVVATHNLAIIEEMNLRTIVLDRGKIIGDFENPRGLKED